ncbi:MAG TPA: hypothetical protein VEB42_12025 [Chitinophagaceae bacterium]|nr:hypothetical protein [Chitinophagaceae bacterium]
MEELVKTLQQQVADAKAANDKLETIAGEAAAKTEMLEIDNAELKALLEAADKNIEALEVENAELKAKLSSCKCGSKTEKAEAPVVKIGDAEYKYKGPKGFVFGGNRYTAEEALTNEDLLKKILELPGQTYLQELV